MVQKHQRLRAEGRKGRLLQQSAPRRQVGIICAAEDKAVSISKVHQSLCLEFWKGFAEARSKAYVPSSSDDLALAVVPGGLLVFLWTLA